METSRPSNRDALDDLPGWDDRKTLYEIFQEHCPVPAEIDLREQLAPALIAVAKWGYARRYEEVEGKDWPYG